MAQAIESTPPYKYYEKTSMYHQELPPTPSSSAFSFLATDQREPEKCSIEEKRMPLNTTMRTTSYYGSIHSESMYSSGQASSSASTISPNDDDEGLYLLWTHQLLREKGFKPSSCRLDDEDEDDSESIDSSITDLSTNDVRNSSFSTLFKLLSRKEQRNTQSSSWFACFPMC